MQTWANSSKYSAGILHQIWLQSDAGYNEMVPYPKIILNGHRKKDFPVTLQDSFGDVLPSRCRRNPRILSWMFPQKILRELTWCVKDQCFISWPSPVQTATWVSQRSRWMPHTTTSGVSSTAIYVKLYMDFTVSVLSLYLPEARGFT